MPLHSPATFQEALTLRRAQQGSIPDACNGALARCNIDESLAATEKQVLKALAIWVEQEGRRQTDSTGEHPYHNRQHIADTLTALSFFLEFDEDLSPQDKTLCLIAMLLHDFGHDGAKANKINANAISQEQRTIYQLTHPSLTLLQGSQLQTIQEWILGTQFTIIEERHEAFKHNPEDRYLRMQTYINEADISASLTQSLGYPLTRLFLLERDGLEPALEKIQHTLQSFHRECLISTPIAKHYLNRE